ncbi:uncharacterized protein V1510DRAFT_415987 [Dipodascopsis tothii]|uniref:uncharacterized protein n=1 Tax=Dipodascopsis tothii TaxID=44089 RepID=UPI0034CDA6F5
MAERRVVEALSRLYKRAERAALLVREVLEDTAQSARQGGRTLEPVPARIPIRNTGGRFPRPPRRAAEPWSSFGTTSRFQRFYSTSRAQLRTQSAGGKAEPITRVPTVAHGGAFGTTLRPKLTGGTLHRSAQGYSLPGFRSRGSARYFSSSPRPMAEVVTNLAQAVRAFGVGSAKLDLSSYEAKMRSQHFLATKARSADTSLDKLIEREYVLAPAMAGDFELSAFLDFDLTPTFALPADAGLSEDVVADMAAAMETYARDSARVVADVRKLAAIGLLPVSVATDQGYMLRVHFPGRTVQDVYNLCVDLDISRGIVRQGKTPPQGFMGYYDEPYFSDFDSTSSWNDPVPSLRSADVDPRLSGDASLCGDSNIWDELSDGRASSVRTGVAAH